MASSACPKCSGHQFEAQENAPRNAAFKQIFIQCTSCGTVVGVGGYYDEGQLLKNQEEQIKEMRRQLANLEHSLNRVIQALQR